MTNQEIIDAIKKLQGAMSRAHDTMRQPTKYVAEAQETADKAIESLKKRTWVELTEDEIEKVYALTAKDYRQKKMPPAQIMFARTIQALFQEKNK